MAQDEEQMAGIDTLRQGVLSSFVLDGRDIFYAKDGSLVNPALAGGVSLPPTGGIATLDEASASKIKRVTQQLFDSLQSQYGRKRKDLQAYFPLIPMPNKLHLQLIMRDDAFASNDGDAVFFGNYLVEADLRAALASNASDILAVAKEVDDATHRSNTAPVPSVGSDGQAPSQEAAVVSALDRIRAFVINKPPVPSKPKINMGHVLGGLLHPPANLDDGPIFQDMNNIMASMEQWETYQFTVVDIATKLHRVEREFYSTLLFSLAHEMGHSALGTIQLPDGAGATAHADAELYADSFGTLLVSDVYLYWGVHRLNTSVGYDAFGGPAKEKGDNLFFFDREDAQRFLGYQTFFDESYELAYGKTKLTSYPEPNLRLAASQKVFDFVVGRNEDSTISHVKKQYDRQLLVSAFTDKITSILK